MLKKLFSRFLSPKKSQGTTEEQTKSSLSPIEKLNQHAPLVPSGAAAIQPASSTDTFLCREAVLGRDQKIAGYQFMLQDHRLKHILSTSRRVQHICAEVLVTTLAGFGPHRLLGHRLAFLDLPDSFLDSPFISRLPPANTVIVLSPINAEGAPSPDELQTNVSNLISQGYLIAIPDPTIITEFAHLLPLANIVLARKSPTSPLNASHMKHLATHIQNNAPQAQLLVRGIASSEDFYFCDKIETRFFQGPFITRREDWSTNNLNPNHLHLATILNLLRSNAETEEIVDLLKHDPILSLRMLRYINSAASGLKEHVRSIKHAFILFGRDHLARWIILLLYTVDGKTDSKQSAVLENALIRARMMEQLGSNLSTAEQEALFLTGLLSLIDIVLEIPLERALNTLALPREISSAVLNQQGPYAALLALCIAFESDDIEQAQEAATLCGVSLSHASQCNLDAVAWATSAETTNQNQETDKTA